MQKVILWILREIVAFSCGYLGILIWGFIVLALLGYQLFDLNILVIMSAILPSIFFIERVIAIWLPYFVTRRYHVAAGVGFIVYASYAHAFLKMVHENPYAASNIKDLILTGLVMGVPSGVLVYELGNLVRSGAGQQS